MKAIKKNILPNIKKRLFCQQKLLSLYKPNYEFIYFNIWIGDQWKSLLKI